MEGGGIGSSVIMAREQAVSRIALQVKRLLLAAIVVGTIAYDVVAMTYSANAQTGTTTFAAGAVTGPVGYQSGAGSGPDNTCWGTYGHSVSGSSCTGTDSKTKDNNLEVTIRWRAGDATTLKIDATAAMTLKNFTEPTLSPINCKQGPPSWAGTSTITLNIPGIGTGGGSGTAGTWAVNLGQGPLQGQDQRGNMSSYAWAVDPQDPDTQTKIVSSKVSCTLNGTVVEEQVLSTSTAKCTLSVTVSVP